MPRINMPANASDDAPQERAKPVNDILDWLSSLFGFQVILLTLLQLFYSTLCSNGSQPLVKLCMLNLQSYMHFMPKRIRI